MKCRTLRVNDGEDPEEFGILPQKMEPIPPDAGAVFTRAVPDAAVGANHWYGKSADGTTYRFSNAND